MITLCNELVLLGGVLAMTSNNQKSVRNGGGGACGAGSSPQARSVEGRLATLRGNRFVVATAKPAVRSSLVTARMLTGGGGDAVLRGEVHYFELHYDRGVSWYRSHFPFRSWARWVARAAGSPAVAFETSPYYTSASPSGSATSQAGARRLASLAASGQRQATPAPPPYED